MTTSHTNVGETQVPGKLAITELAEMKRQGTKIAMVTAYDSAGARLAEAAGMDVVLVGDSAAMVVLGHDSTVPVTMDEMLFMTRAVARAVRIAPGRRRHAVRRTRSPTRTRCATRSGSSRRAAPIRSSSRAPGGCCPGCGRSSSRGSR